MFLEAKQENHQEFQTNDEQHIENIKQILNLDHKNLESHESLIVKKLPQTIRNRIKKLTIGKNEFLKYYKDIITKISEKIQTNKLKIDCSKLSILKSPEFSIKFDFLPMFSECEQTSSKYLLRNIESAFQEVQDNFENQFYGLEDQFSCQNIQNYSFGDRSDNVYISLSQTESLCTSNDQSFASYLKDDNQSLRSIDVQRIDPYSEENFKKFLQPLRSLLKRKKNIQVKRKILSQFENLKCKYKKYI